MLIFEDPPAPRSRATTRARAQFINPDDLATLTQHTGRWARIYQGHNSACYGIARSARAGYGIWAGHNWEAVVARNDDNTTAKLYLRHIAPAQEK
jgi:hypothetical protein